MSAVWVAVAAVNGALVVAALYGWLCGRARTLRPEVAEDQVLSLRSAA